jgi:phosphotransferase system IIA component
LCDFDLKTISKNVPSMDTPIIAVTDSMNDWKIEFIKESGTVKANEPLFKLIKK